MAYESQTSSSQSDYYGHDWPMERVVRWLDANDFKPVIEVFRANHICGKVFLDLSFPFLMSLPNDISLSYSEKRRLVHAVRALKTNDEQQSQPSYYNYPSRTQPNMSNNGSLNARYNTNSRYHPHTHLHQPSDSSVPLIPERTSSNNEQVLDWMKTFIPSRTFVAPNATVGRSAANINVNAINNTPVPNSSRYPINTNARHNPNGNNSFRATENDGAWKFVRRRPPVATTKHLDHPVPLPPQPPQQNIHVTKDSDTFHSLQVSGMHDPRLIKNSILRKLSLEGSCERYLFYHENGKNSVPLTDSELSHLCQISDHTATNRILVKPVKNESKPLERYRSYTQDGTTFQDFAVKGTSYSRQYYPEPARSMSTNYVKEQESNSNRLFTNTTSNTDRFANSPQEENNEQSYFDRTRKASVDVTDEASRLRVKEGPSLHRSTASASSIDLGHPPANGLWPVHQEASSVSSSSSNSSQTRETYKPSVSLWAVAPQVQHVASKSETVPSQQQPRPLSTKSESRKDPLPSLWAVPPSSVRQNEPAKKEQVSLWAVPPTQAPKNESPKKEAVSLWAVPPSSSSSNATNPSATASSPSSSPQPVKKKEPPSLWAVPPQPTPSKSETTKEPASLWAVPPTQPSLQPSKSESTQKEAVSLWAVAPKSSKSEGTSNTYVSQGQPMTVENSKEETNEEEQAEEGRDDCQYEEKKDQTEEENESGLTFGSENLDLHPSIMNNKESNGRGVRFAMNPVVDQDDNESTASAPAAEEGIENHPGQLSSSSPSPPPVVIDHHPQSAQQLTIDTSSSNDRSTTPLSSPSAATSDEENWAERPTVERLYKNIDKYLPGHDLDKEILVDAPQPVGSSSSTIQGTAQKNSPHVSQAVPGVPGVDGATMVTALPPGRRLGAHKKSIRYVANEAHRNWRNAFNVIRANNNLMRRRSTKMWHRAVEQVKPGMKSIDVSSDSSKPKSKKLQWIRGELIGKGSFGRVYHALNVEAGEWIAVKQVDLPTTKADYANPQMREMKDALFREISLLEDLDNEYIVQYLGYDVDEEEGHINIFLEYVPGGSIASCLSKTGQFEEPLVRFLTQQILMGLAYLHNRNILHRDIKAGNILLDQNGVCKITDFGLSKLSGQDKAYDPHSNNSVMRGTVFWMAPEVVKGTNYNAKVDIWSLGCTVIEMLTGNHPWLDLNMLAALYSLGKYQAPPIPEDLNDDVKDFLSKCFTINPEDRPTAEQLSKHPFVQHDPTFEFKKYMKKAEIERRASKRLQLASKEQP
ncbi:hypothetical protein BD560DRAFT_411770 [Blakeslea trispora]|nr:hypothetical protein BD560DRAFT_411770 [Blakeslea trispora]